MSRSRTPDLIEAQEIIKRMRRKYGAALLTRETFLALPESELDAVE